MANVGFATLQVIPSTKGFAPALNKQLVTPMGAAGSAGGAAAGKGMTTSMVPALGKLGGMMGVAFGVTKVVGFLKDAVSASSDLNEAANKVQVVFGSATKAIQTFANGASKSMGMSKLAALDAAATFGVYGKSAGLAGAENAKFAKGMVGLAADFASFYNTSPEEAVQAIGSALRGEAEPIRKYGVLLNDTTLKQAAMRLGLIKTTKEALTPQQRVLAAQNEILKQSKVAQGDFANTQEGLANSTRITTGTFTDLKAAVGDRLRPAVATGTHLLNKVLGGALDLLQKKSPVKVDVKVNTTAAEASLVRLNEKGLPATKMLALLHEKNDPVQVDGAASEASLKRLTKLGRSTDQMLGLLDDKPYKVTVDTKDAETPLSRLGGSFSTLWDTAKTTLGPSLDSFGSVMKQKLTAMAPAMGTIVAGGGEVLIGHVNGLFTSIGGVFDLASGILTLKWSTIWKGLTEIVDGIMGGIQQTIIGTMHAIGINLDIHPGPFMATTVADVKTAVTQMKTTISGWVTSASTTIGSTWATISGNFATNWATIKGTVSRGVGAVKVAVGGWLASASSTIGSVWGSIATTLSGTWDRMTGAVATGVRTLVTKVKSIPGSVKTALSGASTWLVQSGKDIITGLITGVGKMVGALGRKVKSVIKEGITNLLPGSPVKEGPLRVLNNGYAGGQIVSMLVDGMTKVTPPRGLFEGLLPPAPDPSGWGASSMRPPAGVASVVQSSAGSRAGATAPSRVELVVEGKRFPAFLREVAAGTFAAERGFEGTVARMGGKA